MLSAIATTPSNPETKPNGAKVAANLRKFATYCDDKAEQGDALAFLWQVRSSEALTCATSIEQGGDPAEIIGHLSDDTLRTLAAFKQVAV